MRPGVVGVGLPGVHASPGGNPHADQETVRSGADAEAGGRISAEADCAAWILWPGAFLPGFCATGLKVGQDWVR